LRRTLAVLGTLASASTLAGPTYSPARAQSEVFPTGFELAPVIVDVFEPGRPVAFAELPDGRFLIIERNTGNVRVHVDGSATAPIIHTVSGVTIEAERGLLGVAVDPAWPTRPYVYVYYTSVGGVGRLTMFTVAGDLSDPASTNLGFASPYDLLADVPDALDIHNGGTLRFGPDGMLYLSLGDDGNSCAAQNLGILGGEILRLDASAMPGAGGGPPPKADITPPDNPFPGPDANAQLVWAWGLRNPFRFSIDPATGDLLVADVGLASFEEIDHVPFPDGAGANFGWPQREGLIDPGLGLTCGLGNTFVDPIYTYAHGILLTAVIGAPVYRANAGAHAFPAEYDGRVFFTDFYAGWIRCLEKTGDTWALAPPVPGQPSAEDWAQSFLYLADLQVGADGALYVMKLIPEAGRPSGLYRIQPGGASSAPAIASGSSLRLACAPNPARSMEGSTIRWTTAGGAWSLRILDAAGRIVRTARGAGGAAWRWDGRAANGERLAAGVYLVQLRTSGRTVEGKLVVLR
jgi:glucose/arabinose dehydrogenase